jgi:hemoglobin
MTSDCMPCDRPKPERRKHRLPIEAGGHQAVTRAGCGLASAAVYIRSMPTLFEHAGGEEALHRLEQIFYDSVLADPLLRPLFGEGRPSHVDHLTAFTAESFGGPDRFSRELGFAHLIGVHRGLRITEAQRKRFVELYLAALDAAGMPSDAAFREAVREHVEFGSKVAMQNSHAESDDELHPLREVPRWTWAGDEEEV